MGLCLIWLGVEKATGADDVTASGELVFRVFMMLIPLALTAVALFIMRRNYRIDETMYQQIVQALVKTENTNPETEVLTNE